MAKGRFGSGRNGAVERVLTRHTQTFVGTYLVEDGQGFVQVDGAAFPEPIAVGDPGAKGAEPGDKVVIEMVRFPTMQREGEAVLTKLLGARGAPSVDMQAIIHEFGLPDEFPADVLDAASQQALAFDETNLAGRTDFTAQTIITIDPVDARDFDDAISLTKSQDGHWHLGVHIADVAHFVPLGSVLDREASKRGTSVYLPGRVLPMLPETISNSLASLQQGHVRYTKSVIIEFSGDGIPLHTEFHNSAIKVTQRFAYAHTAGHYADFRYYAGWCSLRIRVERSELRFVASIHGAGREPGVMAITTFAEIKAIPATPEDNAAVPTTYLSTTKDAFRFVHSESSETIEGRSGELEELLEEGLSEALTHLLKEL